MLARPGPTTSVIGDTSLAQAVQRTGIGPALRKARIDRGKSIEEASRETHIRAEYLQALERERFDVLPGDVYVRGFLRSYSSYLGLDPDKVLARAAAAPTDGVWPAGAFRDVPTVPEAPAPRVPKPIVTSRRPRLSWPVLVAVAASVLAALVGVGVLNATKSSPPAARVSPPPRGAGAAAAHVLVAVTANVAVHLTVTADGKIVFDRDLAAGEGREFEADDTIRIQLAHGGSAEITVNGTSLGTPGAPGKVYAATFFPVDQQFAPAAGPTSGSTPSPAPSGS
jgi:hypothetical protein